MTTSTTIPTYEELYEKLLQAQLQIECLKLQIEDSLETEEHLRDCLAQYEKELGNGKDK